MHLLFSIRTVYPAVIAPSILVVPILIALIKRKYWLGPQKILFGYLLFSVFFNCIASITTFLHINNMPILHLYTILEFCLLCLLFRGIFEQQAMQKLLIYLLISFSLFAIAYVLLTHSLFRYNTLPRFLSSITIVGICLYFLYLNFANTEVNLSRFNFTTVIGLMLYFSSCSILFGLSQTLHNKASPGALIFVWNLHATIMAIMYLIFAWAFLRLKPNQ
ncbi:hypothetical protein DBR11_05880 [Pedobacter sp. HMWF019]|nr:hypothetical protein DBR11_05880 [Pedobacter sp. HMWF019]